MSSIQEPVTEGYRSTVFGLVTVVCSGITGWAIGDGQGAVTVLLFLSMTMYALGNTLPAVHRRIPRFDRLAGVVLGVVGVGAYAMGAPTDLPIFFTILGVGCVIDLLRDPTALSTDDAE